jgi:transposase
MKRLTISEPEVIILGIQDEMRRSPESRYDHRLHGILLVAQGMSCRQVGHLLGDSPRTVQYWVHRFESEGFAGLVDGDRPGRPARLSDEQLDEIGLALRKSPSDAGMNANLWDGKLLSSYIARKYDIELRVRQSQRLFRRLGFRFRKPRPVIAHADPERQEAHKKTLGDGSGPLY